MPDENKTRAQLLSEVHDLRQRLEQAEQTTSRQMAVDRVRAEALAMRSFDDLRHVAASLFREIRSLRGAVFGCNLAVIDKRAERIHDYAAKRSPRLKGIGWTSPDLVEMDGDIAIGYREYDPSHPNYATYLSQWGRGEVWTIDSRTDDWDRPRGFAEDFDLSQVDEDYFPPELEIIIVPFEHGSVSLHTTGGRDDVVDLVRDFAEAVHLGYVRFLDFRRVTEGQRLQIEEYERELTRAHDLQMGLMPQRAPRIPGYDFAGSCTPARQVGGDMYRAYILPDGRLVGFLADATGHAMEAMIPLMIFAGILEDHVAGSERITQIFGSLNRSLCRALPKQTFVCLSMGILDPEKRTLTVSNSGCPYPYHYSAASGCLDEIALDGYPLGVSNSATYFEKVVDLAPGDRAVFCSDGLVEAANSQGEAFGFDRLQGTIQVGCDRGLTTAGLHRHIVRTVLTFQDDRTQEDDMTIIVVGVRRKR
ncbi:MAG: SpoIIE family protein phosphatase [Candidatus Latescibacteria bacterium]|jgi:serine phosphatase RsbU (regulator of sigma subunit)|nr:hypothetical protein [Gemmatimonadaceae bacterium]MDP6017887.1 SpoIIE family protein phosphatase [Candidatus Latescibacterota bacterium]MDP7449544.1 SpoIIE family protein phosphatase [Candidatus Latescibacterota bacterium]HJP30494.1 SpoIIE family protein phosphatase [Candidatus Latescibacterota bacterium]